MNNISSRMVIKEHKRGIMISHYDPMIPIPSIKAGEYGEQKMLDLFSTIVGKENVFYGPKLKIKQSNGVLKSEVELCDGIVRYGDTLFLIQLKTRNKSASSSISDMENYPKWLIAKTKRASKQRKDTIKWLNEWHENFLPCNNLTGEEIKLNWKKYNLVSILLFAVDDANDITQLDSKIKERTNDKEQL